VTDPKQPAPAAPKQTFFVLEVQGGCEELHGGACTVAELAMETAIAMVRTNLTGRRNVPKLILHRPGTFDLDKVNA
jgi:hypothetical protein